MKINLIKIQLTSLTGYSNCFCNENVIEGCIKVSTSKSNDSINIASNVTYINDVLDLKVSLMIFFKQVRFTQSTIKGKSGSVLY